MCGITGIFDPHSKSHISERTLLGMTDALSHRGPDEASHHIDTHIGLGFRRLSIIDLANGHQPFWNESKSVALICNGEIYNYKELRHELAAGGFVCSTNCDVEVLLHLYLRDGYHFLDKLNGQFAFAIYDKRNQSLFLARDHFGVCPLFYSLKEEVFLFASEIKAILKHPLIKKEVDLTGLDQVFSFPGLVSPNTMFKGIKSLKPGHYAVVDSKGVSTHEYWDLVYPDGDYRYDDKPESYYIDGLEEHLTRSVKYRLNADVPVGFYLSGGLDSSLVGSIMRKLQPDYPFNSFSVGFPEAIHAEYDERRYQRMMSGNLNSVHNEIAFNWNEVDKRLYEAVYYGECPLKETYNTCSLALSSLVKDKNIKVILSGEGADELLGGYVGYRFDRQRNGSADDNSLESLLEKEVRSKLWGDPDFFYERNDHEFRETKKAIYSEAVNSRYKDFDCLERLEISKDKLRGRDNFHKRSYLDLKLRLSDHLISDHCDRVTYANSVEGRYPFLDTGLINFIRKIPSGIKLKGLTEKYVLRQVAEKYLPREITNRQKFSFVAPDSPQLLKNNVPWIEDLLSYDRIKRQGYFNPDVIARIKKMYGNEHFKLNQPFDDDLLIVVLTFNIFLDVFEMPNL